MKAVEFCYWLQGLFELGRPTHLTVAQVEIIEAHLALVGKVQPAHDSTFVAWLTMRLRDVRALSEADTAEVARYLAREFKHVIDPSYGGDPAALQQVHDGVAKQVPWEAGKPVMRC